MGYQIAWANEALHDLKSLVAYIAVNDPVLALHVGEDIIGHTEILRTFPSIGPVYERARNSHVRQVICGAYHIYYQVDADSSIVHILHIWHGARSEPLL